MTTRGRVIGRQACVAAFVAFGVAFWWAASQPIQHTDVWGHLAYGRWIDANGLPTTEPLLSHSSDVPMATTDWFWKWGGYRIAELADIRGLLAMQAFPVGIAAACLAAAVVRRGGSIAAALVAVVTAWWIVKSHLTLRPQTTGLAFFCGAMLLSAGRVRVATGIAVVVLTAAWSNVHGSWVMGVLFLAGSAVGEAVDAIRRRRSAARRLHQYHAVRLGALAVAASAAGLLNPNGPGAIAEVFDVAENANVSMFIEWKPLSHTPRQRFALIVCVAALMLLAVFVRRFRGRDWVVLGPLLVKTWAVSRTIVWCGPITAAALGIALSDLLGRSAGRPSWRELKRRVGPAVQGFAVIAGGIGTVLGAGQIVTAGGSLADPPSLSGLVDPRTPLKALHAMGRSPETAVVWCEQDWGDAILYFQPGRRPLVNSHGHLVPPDVWRHALGIPHSPNAARWLQHYGVDEVLTRSRHATFIKRLTEAGWRVTHEDRLATLLRHPK